MGNVEYKATEGGEVVIARFFGDLTEDMVWPTLDYLVFLDDSQPGYHLILDFSEVVKVDINVPLIHRIRDRVNIIGRRTGKTALVLGEYRMRRTFAEFFLTVLATVSKSPGKVFRSICDANRWIMD